jgi:hypothetical protein
LAEGELPAALNPEHFLSPGILWWAYDWQRACETYQKCHNPHFHPVAEISSCQESQPKGVVLLIDEIDKADADLPNSLLETLDMGRYRIPWVKEVVGCRLPENGSSGLRPLVFITTNEDRQLPPAFLRRCLVLHLALPEKEDELVKFLIGRGRQHFSDANGQSRIEKKVLVAAAKDLWRDRQLAKKLGVMPPGQAEYLDLLRVLGQIGDSSGKQLTLLKKISSFALRKHKGMDQESPGEEPRGGA